MCVVVPACEAHVSQCATWLQVPSSAGAEAGHMCLSCAERCALAPAGEWRVLYPRQQDVEYSASHRGDHLFITQRDKEHPNSQLFVAPLADPSKRTLLLAHRCAAPACCLLHWLEAHPMCPMCARRTALVAPVVRLSDAVTRVHMTMVRWTCCWCFSPQAWCPSAHCLAPAAAAATAGAT